MDVQVEEDAVARAERAHESRTLPYLLPSQCVVQLLRGTYCACAGLVLGRHPLLVGSKLRHESLHESTPEGRRGEPYGHFGQWRLNAYGFRSPEISILPAPAMVRIAALGASETFGLYESPTMSTCATQQTPRPNTL